jgi:uncharacterized membrane protein YraQ (UPF0718 family)
LGIARAVGAIGFSVVIGLIMHFIYRKEELVKADGQLGMPEPEAPRPLWKSAAFFSVMVGVLVFANWGAPATWDYQSSDGATVRVDIVQAPFDPHEPGATYTLRMEGPHAGQPGEMTVEAERFLADRRPAPGVWSWLWRSKWLLTAGFAVALGLILIFWLGVKWWKVLLAGVAPAALALALPTGGLWVLIPFSAAIVGLSVILGTDKGEGGQWLEATWGFAGQILPLLLLGVLAAGFLLGRPGHEGFIPDGYVEMLVGDSPDRMLAMTGWGGGAFEGFARQAWPLWANFFASIFGAFMYFATLTEVPILEGLLGAGMGQGPALALLLAGPALSLPNMLVIRSVMGTQKTLVYVVLVVVLSTAAGMMYGSLVQ